jgi:hypothetical protein
MLSKVVISKELLLRIISWPVGLVEDNQRVTEWRDSLSTRLETPKELLLLNMDILGIDISKPGALLASRP